jgi:hypothetical protein
LIIAIAVLWAMPKNARAQLYVSQEPFGKPGFVSEYNATTGDVLIREFIPELVDPHGLALLSSTQFPHGFLFVAETIEDVVGKYDAKTGGAINASFITGLKYPEALAVLDDSLFVTNDYFDINEVGKYNAITGAVIKAKFITRGLYGPNGLAVLDKTLFVSSIGGTGPTGTVGKYNAVTGAVINAILITGLDRPTAIAVKAKAHEHGYGVVDELFVAARDGTVGKYDATTGGAIKAKFITGLHEPSALAVLGDTLFVASLGDGRDGSGTVGTYDAKTGDAIKAKFITGLDLPQGIAVKSPE